jgi:hypothetical protein
MMLLLLVTIAAQILLPSVDAKCSMKDFAGDWAFTESGTVSTPPLPLSNAGWLRFDDRGNVLGGWVTIRIGDSLVQSTNYSGNLTIIPPCNVRLQLSRPDTKPFSSQGIVSKGKREFFSYSRKPNEYNLGHFARIDSRKCKQKDMDGVYVGSGLRTETVPATTPKVFAETFECSNEGSCAVFSSANPGQSDVAQQSITVTKDPSLLCKYVLPDRVVVRHAKGFFAVITSSSVRGSHAYVQGEK